LKFIWDTDWDMRFAFLQYSLFKHNVAFSRGAGWRGLCPAQTVTDRTVGYNAWLAIFQVPGVHPCSSDALVARFPPNAWIVRVLSINLPECGIFL